MPKDISDIVLKFDYRGGATQAYMNGKVTTDRFYHGPSWEFFGLKRCASEGKSPQFELDEWSDSITGISSELVMIIKKKKQG